MSLTLTALPNAIEQAGSIRRLVENLFYGWGYNAYRAANQQRADDLLIRNEISHLIGQAREDLRQEEMTWRKLHLPAPTRDHPFPDPETVRQAEGWAHTQRALEGLETAIRTAPVPENDRVWQRHRNEDTTLAALRDADLALAEAVLVALAPLAPPASGPRETPSVAVLEPVYAALAHRSDRLCIWVA